AYITGSTSSVNFPTLTGSYDHSHNGESDVFVSKLATSGATLSYSTFLGGDLYEDGYAIALDGVGNAYVTGYTWSVDFPIRPPDQAWDATAEGWIDVFVTKLNLTGSALVYSTYIGGNHFDVGYDITVDSGGRAHITGLTLSTNFPTVSAVQAAHGGDFTNNDSFVVTLSRPGTWLEFSSYLGGSESDIGEGIAVDSQGDLYLTGHTEGDFPLEGFPYAASHNGGSDAFVAKIERQPTVTYPSVFGTEIKCGADDEDEDCEAADQQHLLPNMQQANVSWVRYNAILWSWVQPVQPQDSDDPASYDWEDDEFLEAEAELEQLIASGFTPIVVVRSTPAWARLDPPNDKECGPMKEYINANLNGMDAFANFMKALADRYDGVNDPGIPWDDDPTLPTIQYWE
ncbi:MAG: SBBP repeat-containing protein, partial [Ardenticatenaceae bacterium]